MQPNWRGPFLWLGVAVVCCATAALFALNLGPTHSQTTYTLARANAAAPTLTALDAPAPTALPDPAPSSAPRVNVNTAGEDELCTVNGIGPAMARKIILERETNGPFFFPEDLLTINGIGQKTLTKLISQLALD